MPVFTAKDLATILGATFIGDPHHTIHKVMHPSDASCDSDMIVAFDKTLHAKLEGNPAGAVLLEKGQEKLGEAFKACLLVERPRFVMAKLTELFAPPLNVYKGVHPSAVVDPTAELGTDICIGPLCYVGPRAKLGAGCKLLSQVTIGADVVIGANATFYAGVRIGDRVTIGDNATIHFNTVVGSDGFSFVTPDASSAETAKASGGNKVANTNTAVARIYSLGSVHLGNNIEIGSNTSIDKGTLTDTRIGSGTKIDNLVQIGHNVSIGEDCILCGSVGIAGSTQIGNRVMLAARAGVADHVKVGDDSILMAASQLGGNLPSKSIYMGFPAMPRERFMEQIMHLARLKQNTKKLAEMEEKLNILMNGLEKTAKSV